LESSTPSLVDAALRSLPTILPVLDFSSIKSELFPVIATIFSRTNSLAIKVRGLQAFVSLCGGSNDDSGDDGLDGFGPEKKTSTSSVLDKYTMQEKIVPLVKAIKTKEPAVMMAALKTLKVIGKVADSDFVAMEILPILWAMSLGPHLNLKQFQNFMGLIKSLSSRVEEEQTKKLQDLSVDGSGTTSAVKDDFMSFGAIAGSSLDANGTSETDFEMLVKGKTGGGGSANPLDTGWDSMTSPTPTVISPGQKPDVRSAPTPTFSWSTSSPAPSTNNQFGAIKTQQPIFRTVTPDLNRFEALTPSSTQFSQPLQPLHPTNPQTHSTTTPQSSFSSISTSTSVNWGTATANNNTWATASPSTVSSQQQNTPTSAFSSMSLSQPPKASSFSLSPPPGGAVVRGTGGSGSGPLSGFSLAPPPGAPQRQTSFGSMAPSTSSIAGSRVAGSGEMGMGSGMNMNSMASMSSMASMKSMNSMMNKPAVGMGVGTAMGMNMAQQQLQQQGQQQRGQKSGLDKYESLL